MTFQGGGVPKRLSSAILTPLKAGKRGVSGVPSWIPWLIAAVSTAAFLRLWFREVRRILSDRKNTVDGAARQLAVLRRKAGEAPDDPEAAAVLGRCISIYEQAVDHYNRAFGRPWVCLPTWLMGFHRVLL